MALSFWSILALFGIAKIAGAANNDTNFAFSSIHIDDVPATFMINLPPDSDDVNFYLSAPAWYAYYAIGIGSTMTNSLMLVTYAAADQQHVTVSPRLGTGDTEPGHYSGAVINLDSSSSIQNDAFVVSGTCKGCRSWPGGVLDTNTTAQSFIYALGPMISFASDDVSAGLRRHIGYGHFTMNTIQATGPGSTDLLESVLDTNSTGAKLSGATTGDNNNVALAHGVVMVLAVLMFAPLDMLAADALRRWPSLHMVTSALYLAAVMAGFGLGIKISGQYFVSKKFDSPHQILGFIVIALMLLMPALGVASRIRKKAMLRQGQQQQQQQQSLPRGPLNKAHVWGGWLLWLLLFINCGLGLRFSLASTVMIIGFAVLSFGVVSMLVMIKLCINCCYRKEKARKPEDDTIYLENIYNH